MTRSISILSTAVLVVCSLSATAAATDPFVGDWKLNPTKSKITDQMKVDCIETSKCTFTLGPQPETITLDGTDQPGMYGTTLAVSVEAPNKWKVVRKKDGHVLVMGIWNLSADGNTLLDDFTSYRSDGTTNNVKYAYKRSGPGSGFTATWVGTPEAITSPVILQIRPYEENGLSFADSKAQDTNNVKFDGKDYPHSGPNVVSGYVSSAHRISDRSIEFTDKVAGTLLRTRQLELSPDLKTLTLTIRTATSAEPNIQVFDRQ
jgi:hypothetical protein